MLIRDPTSADTVNPASTRLRASPASIPVLGCTALVVFKTLFDRTKDGVDIEAIVEAGTADLSEAHAWVERVLGPNDPIAARPSTLTG